MTQGQITLATFIINHPDNDKYFELRERVKELVHNPIFQEPIKVTDYSKKGSVTLITQISKLRSKVYLNPISEL